MSEVIVMRDSPEAAQYRTDIKGWVSRHGIYYGDGPSGESTARYAGCTHVSCKQCGKPTEKPYTMCNGCRDLADIARYEAMPEKEWDGTAMLYSQSKDSYYTSPSDADESLEEGESLSDLMLVICEPNYVRRIDADYFCDELPEDGEVPQAVESAIIAFNNSVAGIILSWSPSKTRLAHEGGKK